METVRELMIEQGASIKYVEGISTILSICFCNEFIK